MDIIYNVFTEGPGGDIWVEDTEGSTVFGPTEAYIDDKIVIQQALNTMVDGGRIVLGPGSYYLFDRGKKEFTNQRGSLQICYDNIELVGSGINETTIVSAYTAAPGENPDEYAIVVENINGSYDTLTAPINCLISDLKIDFDNGYGGIWIWGGNYNKIENCESINTGPYRSQSVFCITHGLYLAPTYNTIQHIKVSDDVAYGVFIGNDCHYNTLYDYESNDVLYGIYLAQQTPGIYPASTGNIINNCTLNRSQNYAIILGTGGVCDNRITETTISDITINGGSLIGLNGGIYVTTGCRNNYFSNIEIDATSVGVLVGSLNNNGTTFFNMTITDSNPHGFRIDGTGILLDQVRIAESQQNGLVFQYGSTGNYAKMCSVVNNNVSNVGWGAGVSIAANSYNNVIKYCDCSDYRVSPKQRYGIVVWPGSTGNKILGGNYYGNVTNGVTLVANNYYYSKSISCHYQEKWPDLWVRKGQIVDQWECT